MSIESRLALLRSLRPSTTEPTPTETHLTTLGMLQRIPLGIRVTTVGLLALGSGFVGYRYSQSEPQVEPPPITTPSPNLAIDNLLILKPNQPYEGETYWKQSSLPVTISGQSWGVIGVDTELTGPGYPILPTKEFPPSKPIIDGELPAIISATFKIPVLPLSTEKDKTLLNKALRLANGYPKEDPNYREIIIGLKQPGLDQSPTLWLAYYDGSKQPSTTYAIEEQFAVLNDAYQEQGRIGSQVTIKLGAEGRSVQVISLNNTPSRVVELNPTGKPTDWSVQTVFAGPEAIASSKNPLGIARSLIVLQPNR